MDYANIDIVEANLNNLQQTTEKDVYVVTNEFDIAPGIVTCQDGNTINETYTVEVGWVILTEPEVEIIDDYENRFEWDPQTIKAIEEVL